MSISQFTKRLYIEPTSPPLWLDAHSFLVTDWSVSESFYFIENDDVESQLQWDLDGVESQPRNVSVWCLPLLNWNVRNCFTFFPNFQFYWNVPGSWKPEHIHFQKRIQSLKIAVKLLKRLFKTEIVRRLELKKVMRNSQKIYWFFLSRNVQKYNKRDCF